MLFISLPCAFFRDFSVSPAVSPPEIVFISHAGGFTIPYPRSSVLIILPLVSVGLRLSDVLL